MPSAARPAARTSTARRSKPAPVTGLTEAALAYLGSHDPVDQAKAAGTLLRLIPEAQAYLRADRQRIVLALRAAEHPWTAIGELLGVSYQRAQQIARGITGQTGYLSEDSARDPDAAVGPIRPVKGKKSSRKPA